MWKGDEPGTALASKGGDGPDGGALLRGLTEEEADLLEGFGEGVSGGHCVCEGVGTVPNGYGK